MKKIQSIYQVIRLKVPLNSRVDIGRTNFVFTDRQLRVFKNTGRPVRITDEGTFLAPEMGITILHPGVYLVIETDCTDESDDAEHIAREANEECAAAVSLLFGKRASEVHIADNVFNGDKISLVIDAMRNPMFQPLRTISSEEFDRAETLLNHPAPENAPNIELALRWYMKGRREPYGPDAYLFFWVAVEVLFGEWKNLDHKVAERLSTIIPGNFSAELVRSRLKLGRLVALRGDIVHKGKQRFATPAESYQLVIVREILEELLKAELVT